MHQKENRGRRKAPKQALTATADVSGALKMINNNNWKNISSKFTKTITNKTINPKNIMKNIMTQEDLDQLFNKSKEKPKLQRKCQAWNSNRDFLNSVQFLKIDDTYDRLLTGIPEQNENENVVSRLFDDQPGDLTVQFKNNYLVGKVVGQGAYASVRVAIYKPLNKKIAIKVYEKTKIQDIQRRKSVRRQIKILQMTSHPNIVRIYDVVQTNHHLNIVMEYVSGISLNSYLKSQPGGRATQKSCRKIIKPLVQALKSLHTQNIAHRDIKLQNVILNEQLQPKLIDFGFSTCIERTRKVKIFCGTPSYMAPEIVQKKEYRGECSDIWALGVLFFVVLTGIFPFRGATDEELYKKINSSIYPRSELFFSKEAGDLIARMLRINTEERITAEEILNHPWIKCQSGFQRKNKRVDSAEGKRKMGHSSQKSKDKDTESNQRKLTETCKDNLKLELKAIKQSPGKLNATYTQRRGKDVMKTLRSDKSNSMKNKKESLIKTHTKVLDLLRVELRKRRENKSKGKIHRG